MFRRPRPARARAPPLSFRMLQAFTAARLRIIAAQVAQRQPRLEQLEQPEEQHWARAASARPSTGSISVAGTGYAPGGLVVVH
jgi:hypothetical protein